MLVKVCIGCKKIYPFNLKYCLSNGTELRGLDISQIRKIETNEYLNNQIPVEGFNFDDYEVTYDFKNFYNSWINELNFSTFKKLSASIVSSIARGEKDETLPN